MSQRDNILRRLLKRRIMGPYHKRLRSRCWLWGGYRNGDGYGQIRVGRKVKYCHKVALWLWKNVPLDTEAIYGCHKCDNAGCFNPSHLDAKTPGENNKDTWQRNRRASRPPLTPEKIARMLSVVRSGKQTLAQWAAGNGYLYSRCREAMRKAEAGERLETIAAEDKAAEDMAHEEIPF